MNKMEELITPRELAAFCKVSKGTVYQWIYLGWIKTLRLHPGNRGPVRFTPTAVDDFLNRHKGGKYKCQIKTSKNSKTGDTKSENQKGLEES